jgi:predicted flap endonuclease-1-like 5' DNA nuclease
MLLSFLQALATTVAAAAGGWAAHAFASRRIRAARLQAEQLRANAHARAVDQAREREEASAERVRRLLLEAQSRGTTHETLRQEHARVVEQLDAAHAEMIEAAARTAELEAELAAAQRELSETEGALTLALARTGELEALPAALRQRDGRIKELERLLAEGHGEMDAERQRARHRESELKRLREQLREHGVETRVTRVERRQARQAARPAEPMRAPRPAAPARKDDLKLIAGIGPVLERVLNRLGVQRFQQIAEWTDADVERLTAQAIELRGRIQRERWAMAAQEQHRRRYGSVRQESGSRR